MASTALMTGSGISTIPGPPPNGPLNGPPGCAAPAAAERMLRDCPTCPLMRVLPPGAFLFARYLLMPLAGEAWPAFSWVWLAAAGAEPSFRRPTHD